MTKRALVGLMGVAMLGMACGTSPTAVEIPVAPAAGDGMASASGSRPLRGKLAVPACEVAKVQIDMRGSNGWRENEMKSVRLRAIYYAPVGKPTNPACDAPIWGSNKEATLVANRNDGFEAILSAPGGKHTVTATAPGGVTTSLTVFLD
jgi:hypothetical protein